MKKFTKSLLIIALAILPMTFFGQEKTASNNWFIGIEGGATQMFADNEAFLMDQTSWDAGIFGGLTVKNALTFYVDLGYVNLKAKNGDWMTMDECNLFQGNINVGYNVLQLFGFDPDRRWSVMPHIGLGAIMHRSKTTFSNGTTLMNGYDDEGAVKGHGFGGRKVVYTNNFGIKLGYAISQKFDLGLDVVAVKTDTEGLDNWRNGKHSDWYGYANIGIAYKFGRKEVKPCPDCPECPEVEPAAPDCEACKDAIKEAVEEALKNYQPAPAEPEREAEPETESVLKNFEEKDIHLTFKVGKAEVIDNQANREEVKKVSEDIDNGREIHTILTIGHASPEGNVKSNQKLSEDRAEATAKFIEKKLGDQAEGIKFQSKGEGSDWEGFYTALDNSNISNKAEIAKELRNIEDDAERTAKLNEFRSKNAELDEILNPLRVTRIYINK